MPAMLYNPTEEQLRFLFRWKATLLPMVATDPLFWFLVITHVGLLLKQRALLDAGADGGSLPFQGIVTADDIPEGKPSPAGYLQALKSSGLRAQDGLALEDSAAGLQAAAASGLCCLLTPSPWDRELENLQGLAVAVLEHLGEPDQPAGQRFGPPCPQGLVTLEYLKLLMDSWS